jgi:hypothetical protein
MPAGELYQIYHRLAAGFRGVPLPVTLDGIEEALISSDYLKRLGCLATVAADGGKWLAVNDITGVPDSIRLTTSRSLHEHGLGGGTTLRFASYGEPVFHAIIDHVQAHEKGQNHRGPGARQDGEGHAHHLTT